MELANERNILRIGPPVRPDHAEITPAMVEAVRQRIEDAAGVLTVWAVLHEDVYETRFGDGFYLHVRGIALSQAEAHKLAALASRSEFTKWHVRDYRLGLKDDAPAFLSQWPPREEFTINDFVEILSEIPPSGTASKLMTGSGVEGRQARPPHSGVSVNKQRRVGTGGGKQQGVERVRGSPASARL